MKIVNSFLSVVLCCLSLTACGGTGSGSLSTSPPPGTTDGLGGAPHQSFAERVAQTPYPESSLLNNPEAMKRVLGEDKDANGIRDDVDVFINLIAETAEEKKAYQQYSRVLQNGFLVATKAEAFKNFSEISRGLLCFEKVAKAATASTKEKVEKYKALASNGALIKKTTVNSVERLFRFNEVDGLAHGAILRAELNPSLNNVCD